MEPVPGLSIILAIEVLRYPVAKIPDINYTP
jgi:hypothetical protein